MIAPSKGLTLNCKSNLCVLPVTLPVLKMSASAGGAGSPGSALSAGSAAAPGPGMSMFRWLEVLEKEFDKAFVDVDLLLGEIDPDQADITYEGRQKMTSLSSCFAQLCHKAQTIFQLNHKLEVRKRDEYDLLKALDKVNVLLFTDIS